MNTKRRIPKAEDAGVDDAVLEMKRAGLTANMTRKQREQLRNIVRAFGLLRWAGGYTEGEKAARLDAAATLAELALEPKRGQHVVFELAERT